VLHRLFVSGSDRAADRWREDYRIAGIDGLDLHHLYRAMAWLGEQDGRTPFASNTRRPRSSSFEPTDSHLCRIACVPAAAAWTLLLQRGGQLVVAFRLESRLCAHQHRSRACISAARPRPGAPIWRGDHLLAHLIAVTSALDDLPQSSSISARQPVSSHSRSNTSAGPMRRLAIFTAQSSATAESTSALLATRVPDRNSRSSCPLCCSSSYRPSETIKFNNHRRGTTLSRYAPANADFMRVSEPSSRTKC
jgi:hypothetical protein